MLLQLLANGLITGCGYALVALSFGLIYNTTRTFHFAHGAVYTVSAYVFFSLFSLLHLPLAISFLLTMILMGGLGLLIDELIYAPLVKKGASLHIQMLSSIGLYIVLINLIAWLYGNDTKILSSGLQPTVHIGGVILSRIQLIIGLAFLTIMAGFYFLLKKTILGKLMRAMRDDPILLSTLGINPRNIRGIAFVLGSSLAAIPAILIGLDVGMDPNVGMSAFLSGAVAVIIGGSGVFEGAAVGGLMLGVLQGLAVWKISSRWQDAITFLLLIIFLLLRPQGILGKRRRAEEIAV